MKRPSKVHINWFLLCGTAKGIPLWMYYVRTLLALLENFLNLFALLFHRQFGFSIDWIAHMLTSMSANWKKERQRRDHGRIKS